MPGVDLLRSPEPGDLAGGGQHVPGPRGEPGELGALPPRHEALLRGLLGHAQADADLAPGRTRTPRLVDEIPDQRVRLLVEAGRDGHRVREVVERYGKIGHASIVS